MELFSFKDNHPNFEGEMKKDGQVQKLWHVKIFYIFNSRGDNLKYLDINTLFSRCSYDLYKSLKVFFKLT